MNRALSIYFNDWIPTYKRSDCYSLKYIRVKASLGKFLRTVKII